MFYIRLIAFLYLLFWPLSSFAKFYDKNNIVGQYKDVEHGRAHMQGSIIDSACAIDTSSRYQTVSLGVVSASEIEQFGHSADTKFVIHLVNCSLVSVIKGKQNWNYFSVTFDANSFDGNLFGLDGDSRGIGVSIRDEYGNVAMPGQAMPASVLEDGDIQLNYLLRLEKDHEYLHVGNYHTVIRYKLEYY